MEYSIFIDLVEQELEYLYEKFLQYDFDCDYNDHILQISAPSGVYVINKHRASRQIWLSSPLSQGNYFDYHLTKEQWLNKNGQGLREILSQDLQKSL